MKTLKWLLTTILALGLLATPALAQSRRTIPRLSVDEEFRPPTRTNCSRLNNQRKGTLCLDSNDSLLYAYTDKDGDGTNSWELLTAADLKGVSEVSFDVDGDGTDEFVFKDTDCGNDDVLSYQNTGTGPGIVCVNTVPHRDKAESIPGSWTFTSPSGLNITKKIDLENDHVGINFRDLDISSNQTEWRIFNQLGALWFIPEQNGQGLIFGDGTLNPTQVSFYSKVVIEPNKSLTINGVEYHWPSADGSNGYVLTTSGHGYLSWTAKGSGSSSGEANTASNLGGGLSNYDSKNGVDLRFNSFAPADFDLASNLISIDDTKWAKDSELHGDGANCAAGTYPLGVDANGAVQSCTTDDDVPDAGDFGAATDLDANGAVSANAVALGTDTTGNYVSGATTDKGLTRTGTEGATLGLIETCSDGELLKWTAATSTWACATDSSGGTGGSPGGSDRQVQFNDSGTFGGASGFSYYKGTDDLQLADGATISCTSNPTSESCIGGGDLSIVPAMDTHASTWIGHGAYCYKDDQCFWTRTHASFGSRGIKMRYNRGIVFFADGVATTADTAMTPTERMIIGNNGNVGIGQTNPVYKLDVTGDSRATGTAYAGKFQVSTPSTATAISLFNSSGSSGGSPRIQMREGTGTTSGYLGVDSSGYLSFWDSSLGVQFQVRQDGDLWTGGDRTYFNGLWYTWPTTQSASTCLQTDGSGNLSWASCGSGGGTALTVEEADGSPTVSNVSTIQFDSADGLTVTDETGGQVQIDLVNAPDSAVSDSITVGSGGSVAQAPVRLEQSTGPSNTVEGRIQWDTDDDRIVVGTGSSLASFYSGAHTTDTTCNDGSVVCNFAGASAEGGAASTALALDANGANCSAGHYPLGVDASGAAESCTVDDDVPDAGDFAAATDLDLNGALLADSVDSAEIATNAVAAAEIAAGAVGASEIDTDAVGQDEIATDAVHADEIAAGAVGTSELATDAVTSAKIAADAVTATEIAADAVSTSEIATDAVTAAEIAADAVGTSELDDGTSTPTAGYCVKVGSGATGFDYGACGGGSVTIWQFTLMDPASTTDMRDCGTGNTKCLIGPRIPAAFTINDGYCAVDIGDSSESATVQLLKWTTGTTFTDLGSAVACANGDTEVVSTSQSLAVGNRLAVNIDSADSTIEQLSCTFWGTYD